jgi:uncharacterized membrane protein
MALPWVIYAGVVVLGATGIHFFSKIAKGSIDPIIALVYTMVAGLVFSLCFLPFASEPFAKSFSEGKAVVLYALVGVCIAFAHLGIYWMFQAGAPISIATPLVRFAPAVFAVLLGVLFFQESLKLHHAFGLFLAACGFFLMTRA